MNNASNQMHNMTSFLGYQQIPVLKLIWNWLTGRKYEFPPDYFLPGQVVLHLEHPANISEADLAQALTDFLSGTPTARPERQAKSSKRQKTRGQTVLVEESKPYEQGPTLQEQPWRNEIDPPRKESVIKFPMKDDNGNVISIVRLQLKKPETRGSHLFHFIKSINDGLESPGLPIGNGIILRAGSPNWLMSAAHHGPATGGPGGWPVEAHPPLETHQWKPTVTIDRKNSQAIIPFAPEDIAGNKVYVAILDTAPTQHALDTAYAEWRWQKHNLIVSMLPSGGPLQLHSATEADFHTLHETLEYSILGHRYWARDHGLFIAGLIHSLAPKAALHLYEVLNPFAVGTLETIAQGLVKVLRNSKIKRPLVINCSFMLNLPDEDALEKEFDLNPPDPTVKDRMTTSIREIFERLTNQKNIIVVAAAGNESQDGSPRRPTCYPAAFERVFGVGAMQNSRLSGMHEVAHYSNRADDRNPGEGYMMFGGEPGEGRGVLGVYIDDFPVLKRVEGSLRRLLRWLRIGGRPRPGHLPARPGWLRLHDIEYERNTTGWAWWAGTSFATAILTGTLAALSNPKEKLRNFRNAKAALDELQADQRTTEDETIIRAIQG